MWESKHICQNVRRKLARQFCIEGIVRQNAFLLVIEGPLGSGKSTLALKIAYELLQDWDKVFELLIFTPMELQDKVDQALKEGIRYPLIVWDDAGPWMQIVKRYPYDPFSVAIMGHIETMRTWTGFMIMTMTSEKHLPRGIIQNGYVYRYKARVWKVHYDEKRGWMSEARVYTRKQREDGKFYWDSSEIKKIQFWLFREGDPVYERYAKIRQAYAEFYNRVLERAKNYGKLSAVLKVQWSKRG